MPWIWSTRLLDATWRHGDMAIVVDFPRWGFGVRDTVQHLLENTTTCPPVRPLKVTYGYLCCWKGPRFGIRARACAKVHLNWRACPHLCGARMHESSGANGFSHPEVEADVRRRSAHVSAGTWAFCKYVANYANAWAKFCKYKMICKCMGRILPIQNEMQILVTLMLRGSAAFF